MNFECTAERESFLQQLGARDQRIQQLEEMLGRQKDLWEMDAREWQRLQKHRQELADWLVDGATNDTGKLIHPLLDAGLRGELFVACSFTATVRERRYRIDLVSTQYEVQIVDGNG